MLDWFIFKAAWLVEAARPYASYFLYLQVVMATSVLVLFEYHWQMTKDEAFYLENIELIENADRMSYELFRWGFAVIPLISIYLFGRQLWQRFDSVAFLTDYTTKRDF